MPEERRSKLPSHDSKKVPDPSSTCPRCHHFEQTAAAREVPDRMAGASGFPRGIDQNKAAEILTKAFPQKQRSYG
jgi:hypothetical protein